MPTENPYNFSKIGDLMVLAEGDRLDAEATVLQANELSTDVSQLSGESTPVTKRAVATDAATDTEADTATRFFADSMVVGDQGLARVTGLPGCCRPAALPMKPRARPPYCAQTRPAPSR
jgi:hypothetical protein